MLDRRDLFRRARVFVRDDDIGSGFRWIRIFKKLPSRRLTPRQSAMGKLIESGARGIHRVVDHRSHKEDVAADGFFTRSYPDVRLFNHLEH
jgi:hypothetical protein